MSSSISYENCPRCGSEGSLYMELNCRTAEDEHFCLECGYSYSYRFARDENDDVIINDMEYDIAYCVLGMPGGDGLKWQKKLSEIPGGYLDILPKWAGLRFHKDEEYEKKLASIFGKEVPDGYRNVYYIGEDGPEALNGLGHFINIKRCTDDVIVVEVAKYEEEINEGYGVINVSMISGGGSCSSVPKEASREDVLKEVEHIKDMNPTTVKGVYATWFNPETKTLEVLSEIERDENEEEDTVETTETSTVSLDKDNLPF